MSWFLFVLFTWTLSAGGGLLFSTRLTELSFRLWWRTLRKPDEDGRDIIAAFLLMGVVLDVVFGVLFLMGVTAFRSPEPVSIVTGVVSISICVGLTLATGYLMRVLSRRFP